MGNLTLNGATSGQITLAPPSVAGTNTLTLPAKTGNIITSADTGTVSQAMLSSNVAGTAPAFSAYMSSNQTISSGVFTKLSYNTKIFDTNTNFDTTLYRFTPTVAGYYFITFSSDASSSTAATRALSSIYKNGTAVGYSSSPTTGAGQTFSTGPANALIYMNGSTDYVEAYLYIVATTAIAGGGIATSFNGYMVRAA